MTAPRSSTWNRSSEPSPRAGGQDVTMGFTEDNIVRLLHRGDQAFQQGAMAKGLYLVKAGAIKSYTISEGGEQQILGFHLAGDIIGFDALADGCCQSTAEALDTSAVTLITFERLYDSEKALRQEVFRQMSGIVQHDNELMLLMARRTAEQRLAWFLTQFSARLELRGLHADEFTLPMSRADIGNYLGLAMETVCREFAALKDCGVVEFERRRVAILGLERLQDVADGGSLREPPASASRRATLH